MAIVRTTKEETPMTGAPAKKPNATRPSGRPLPQRAPAKPSGQFINETQAELRRVTWPTGDQVRAGTIVTVLMLAFFAVYVSGLDYVIERIFQAVGVYGPPTS
ncbi:MAG TPA: preprotein translocase subunit SecE [Abditibacteriaceae bacterium]|jgi:preprotein translocase SecE subunit